MWKVSFFLLYFGLFTISIGGQINSDPAPGRSPGPPGMNTIEDDHGVVGESPTLLLTKDDNYPDSNSNENTKVITEKEDSINQDVQSTPDTKIINHHNGGNINYELNYGSADESVQQPDSANSGGVSSTVKHSDEDFMDNVHEGYDRDVNEIRKTSTEEASPNSLCKNKLSDYLHGNDKIVNIDDIETNSSEDDHHQHLPSFDINIEVLHEIFETSSGITCGLMYKVHLWTNVSSVVNDFFVETMTDGKERGSFVGEILSNKLPISWFKSPFVKETKWALEKYPKRSSWDVDSEEENVLQPIGKWADSSKFLEDETSRKSEMICNTNKWTGEMKGQSKAVAFWILNEFCDKDDNIEFRLFFRSSNKTGIVFKKSFATIIKPDCELFLKRSTGNMDYTSLPLYNLDCTVFFPSHEEVSFPQPPGILIELVRLNVPCDSGGYIQFSERSRLCGKLEELSVNERTYHFDLNQNSSVKIHKSPMFSLRYQLVDYCYNMTLVNRNGSFFIQPVRDTLQCYFRIHLPYGYKIDLNLITNNDSDLHQGDKFTNEATYENLRVNLMSHINFSFSNNSNKLTDKSTNNIPADGECSGILFSVHDTKLYKWSHCVNENSAMKGFSLVSQSNTLEIEVLKTKSATAQHPFSRYSETTERTEAKMTKLPTLFFTYSAKPVLDIVSDCAFGWVAVQQFCMSTVETAMSWHQGEQFCASQGGHLASIRSEIEQRTIDQLLINSPGYQDHYAYWVGGSDKNFEGDFRWTDGLPFQYTNWFPGWSQHGHYNKQPNDDGLSGQDCIELRRYFRTPPGAQTIKTPLSNTFMWNDRDCNAQNFVICERAMTEVSIQKNWANDCNKTVSLTKEHPKASLWSPSFPRQYPDNANCYTTVTAPSGYRIVLEFEELVIENEPGCSYDYLEITEPTSTHANAKGNNDPTRVPRHGLRKNTYRKRNSYENIGLTGNFEIAQASYQNLLNIFSNLYKPRANFLIQTPDYPRGNPLYPTTKLHETLPKRMCGDWSSKLKLLRYVSVGSYLGLHFVSDYSHHFGGFKAKVYMENTASECSDERLKPYNGSCYLFVSYPEVEWWTAQQVCRGISAQLSSISSPDEHRFITTSIRNQVDYSPQLIYWLGGELTTNRTFEWSDGSRMIFQGWLPGQGQFDELPSESTCLGLQWKMSPTPMLPSGLYWDAQRCRRMGGYVCKKRQQPFDQFELKNETIRGVEGRLTSHGYPNPYPLNIDYWIHIIAPERRRIIMQFQKIDLESQDECLYDYVSIQNYETASKISLEPGANPIPMAMLTSDKNYDEMRYQSYKLQHDRHVRSAVGVPANENFITKSASRIKLKKFDIPHSNPPLQKISFYSRETLDTSRKNFNEIQLSRKRKRKKDNHQEKLRDSYQHKVTKRNTIIPEVDNAQSFLPYVRWCGSHETDMSKFDFVSASNEAILNFHSDYSVSGLGFAAIWKAIDISGCPLQTLTSREGTVTSSNYPYFLINNLDCTYVIQAPLGGKVWLEFTDFEILEESFLYIDIGNGPFQPFLVTDHLNEGIFVSLKEQIRIQIRTGQKPRGRGFRATFKTVGPFVKDRVIKFSTNSTGYLFPLNHPQIMPGNIDFTQHFMAPLGEIILLELYGVEFSQNGCSDYNILEVYDNYADNNGTRWQLCKYQNHSSMIDTTTGKDYSNYVEPQQAPVYITSYLNTIHIRQKTTTESHINLNATIRVQPDVNYKLKLASGDDLVESCQPNPCQYKGKCITNGKKKRCQCHGHYTGRFCGLNMCELEPCLFGKCELTANNFKCHCQPGYIGQTCEQKQKPCADNPCEGRGECFPKNGGFVCRCHAWWEGQRCERRMMHIPYKPLSDRMLQEPFWLGLITVFVVLAVIGLVWCAKRHFPEKIEKLLAEEADRNRPPGAIHGHHHHTSLREQLQFTTSIPQTTATTPGAPRSIFNRLGIRKPSILSLSSPNPPGGATARTFSLDDLLRPPPRRSPSPRKKRNNSTPTKKNAAEKKQILQQLVSPATAQVKPKISLGELIQMSENRLKVTIDSESDVKETTFSENSASGSTSTARAITDPKLEKKVTFARLLSKVSAEMSSGSEVEAGNGTQNSSALSLPTEIQYRANSVPPSPCTNDIRSPHSTSSNQGSDSLSSSELALTDLGLRNINSRRTRPKVSSADSILAMFRNFATTAGTAPTSSVFISPSTTPTASSPQDDVPGDDDSSTSSMHTPVSYSSGPPDSPVFYRQTTIEVPVLDALSAHKTTPNTNLLHPPTILLEIPSNGINKCLSPIRELPTPMPSPALTPIMPRLQRTISPSSQDDPLSGSYSDDDDKSEQQMAANIISELHKEMNRIDSEVDTTPTDPTTSIVDINKPPPLKIRAAPKLANIMIDIEPPTPDEKTPRPRDLVIPTLTVEQPSPTKDRFPMIIFPGSPPPQRASIGETSFMFPNKQQQKRLLKQFEKPTSLDLPFTPPTITVTSNMSELESDAEPMSPAPNKLTGATTLLAPGNPVGMCYLSPFAICTRADRTISESNLSSSGYSSMASPGPSRCGSSNPLCPNEMDESGSGPPGSGLSLHANLLSRRQNSVLASCKENITNGKSSNGSAASHDHLRGRSDSETLSDDPLLESNDEGIGTDHLEEKVDDGEGKASKELEVCLEKDLIESGKSVLGADEVITMSQLQLPSIVIQADGSDRGLSPVSSRSESPLSERAGMGRFSPHFYGRKDQQLPFTDSDGLYDFPSSDGKGASITHHRRSSKKRERKPSKTGLTQSPTKNLHLDLPSKDTNSPGIHNCSKHFHHLHHPHHGTTITTRKSPKRRPIQRHPIASSSSSSESLTSARELTLRAAKRACSPGREKCLRKRPDGSEDDTDEDVSSQILPNAHSDEVAKPRKISRLRAIGNQIRFLRRLEQSIRKRDKLLSPSDSCPEDGNDDLDSPRITSPLLQLTSTNKPRTSLCRQKRLPTTSFTSAAIVGERGWRGRGKNIVHGEINSD